MEQNHEVLSELHQLLDQQTEALKEEHIDAVDAFEYTRRALRVRELLDLLGEKDVSAEHAHHVLIL